MISLVSVDSKFGDRCGDAGSTPCQRHPNPPGVPVNKARVAHTYSSIRRNFRGAARLSMSLNVPPPTPCGRCTLGSIPEPTPPCAFAEQTLCFSKIMEFHLGRTRPSLLSIITHSVLSADRRQGDSHLAKFARPLHGCAIRTVLCWSSIPPPPLKSNALKEDFRGALQLYAGLAHRDGFNMLINVPTGSHIPKGESVWRRHARSLSSIPQEHTMLIGPSTSPSHLSSLKFDVS